LVDAVPLVSYAFVFFVRVGQGEAEAIRDTILKKWSIAGMDIRNLNMKQKPLVVNPNIEGNIKGGLMSAFKQATTLYKQKCQLIVCIVDGDKNTYERIKKVCLCEAGVMSQCMLQKNVRSADAIKDQYIANVALKVSMTYQGEYQIGWQHEHCEHCARTRVT
jgi:eukaryotic translation initiation factor 2C